MKERVLQRMKELNYQPNLAARSLVTGKTYLLGLVVPDLVHAFFAEVAKGLSNRLREQGYGLVIASSEEDPELEREEIDMLLARQVDALVIASAQTSGENLRRVEQWGVPLVLIDRQFPGIDASYVGVDDHEVGRMAVEHLIAGGRTRIAHIRGPEISPGNSRYAGYRAALEAHGLPQGPEYVVPGKSSDVNSEASGYEAMKVLLTLKPRPDAVFCFNDPTALGAMKAIFEAGLQVPDDIAVAGAGNLSFADMLRAPLTSVDQSSYRIGEEAAKLALKLVASKGKAAAESVLLKPRLVARESSRAAGAG
jgi:LacI family transcriptional regulator